MPRSPWGGLTVPYLPHILMEGLACPREPRSDLATHSALCLPVIEVASGEYGDLNPMLFKAVQNGLCAMAEKKSSPEKNEVPTPCPPCPQVSRAGEGREGKVGAGRWDPG